MLKRLLIPLLALFFAASAASAQQGYQDDFFSRNSPTAFRYNPAMLGETGFLAVSNVAYRSRANYGARNFLFEYGDKVVTALHPSVDADKFLNGLKPLSNTLQSGYLNLFSYGIRKENVLHTFELNLVEIGSSSVAKDIFEIAKTGFQKGQYTMGNTRISSQAYTELAYGYSRRLSDIVSIGARAKLLLGLASFDTGIKRFTVDVESEDRKADIAVDFEMTGRKRDINEARWILTFDPKQLVRKPRGLSGLGMAFDLGILIQPNEYLTLSASANNLGLLWWVYNHGADLSASFSLASLINCIQEPTTDSIMEAVLDIGNDLLESAKYQKMDKSLRARAIPIGFDLGIKYAMPFYDRLSVGLTGNYTLYNVLSDWEVRLGLTITPWNWFEFTGSYGYGTYKSSYSFAAAFKFHHFRLSFTSQDCFGGKLPGTPFHLWEFNRYLSFALTYMLD